ncbi:ATP-binding cassette domain-containing protein [Paraburkholderia bonniea]|uniref:quaternary amine ABC transporter ATP-binding protein n=1 Tax=Paraburkholderia bonniea TaxID=2152891 RepID=UPI001FE3B220|nr:ATP-binding cassette domain-containing protein [Paraburkholderia bonniea]WJF90861.1 ATP-binding cassette domain-containing protein [Paraburkholderia bonniea]WJF94175.1 ATP-binding cassette domain-containing protein [Paraburkholderia bonniea]
MTQHMMGSRDSAVSSARAQGPAMIDCRGIWKVFGAEDVAASVKRSILSGALDPAQARRDHGCVVSVQDVSFTVYPGEIFCVMGLSGSGKSTLIRHLNRLIDPTAGEIVIDGESICRYNASELRALRATRVGMVFQNMALLPHRSVESNVGLALELRGVSAARRAKTVAQVLDVVGLGGWGGCQVQALSGGMQQRVGLARALAADPGILLMDEPFSALDPLIRRQLQNEFRSLSRDMGKTTVFITHDLDEAIRLGDRIAIMKDGRFVQVGTPAEIVMQPADGFVAEFVQGISRMHLVHAGQIMLPLEAYLSQTGQRLADLNALPQASDVSLLHELIDLAVAQQQPIAIHHAGVIAGVVTPHVLLQTVREGHPA